MRLRLFRITLPCEMLVVAPSLEDAIEYAVDDYDAQEQALSLNKARGVAVTRHTVSADELQKKPFLAEGAEPSLADTTEQWLKLIEADERAEAEFLLKQLRLPGVE